MIANDIVQLVDSAQLSVDLIAEARRCICTAPYTFIVCKRNKRKKEEMPHESTGDR